MNSTVDRKTETVFAVIDTKTADKDFSGADVEDVTCDNAATAGTGTEERMRLQKRRKLVKQFVPVS